MIRIVREKGDDDLVVPLRFAVAVLRRGQGGAAEPARTSALADSIVGKAHNAFTGDLQANLAQQGIEALSEPM